MRELKATTIDPPTLPTFVLFGGSRREIPKWTLSKDKRYWVALVDAVPGGFDDEEGIKEFTQARPILVEGGRGRYNLDGTARLTIRA